MHSKLKTQINKLPFYARPIFVQLAKNWVDGGLKISLPKGDYIEIGDMNFEGLGHLQINNYRALRRIIFSGDIGLYQGYEAGDWQSDDIFKLLNVICLNLDGFQDIQSNGLAKNTIHLIRHWLRPNNKDGSRQNIYAHYDLGNDFFNKWLDGTMTYSAAIFDNSANLEAAQTRKYAEIAKSVDLKSGDNVLEIGCGWGGFATYAAQTIGANVTCVTISQSQFDFTQKLINEKGLQDKVKLVLQDYRDIKGTFDAIVSIEMFEAVGEAYWPVYFNQLQNLLKPNGKVGLQIITIRDDLFDDYRAHVDFIQNYIFPGGMLPSVQKLYEIAIENRFNAHISRAFGLDYYKTLLEWKRRFEAAWQKGQISGFDINFKKLWDFYLAYCAAGFQSKRTDVVHLVLSKQ